MTCLTGLNVVGSKVALSGRALKKKNPAMDFRPYLAEIE